MEQSSQSRLKKSMPDDSQDCSSMENDPDITLKNCIKNQQIQTVNKIGILQLKYLDLLSPFKLAVILGFIVILGSLLLTFAEQNGEFNDYKSFFQVFSKSTLDIVKFLWSAISTGISSVAIFYMLAKNRPVPLSIVKLFKTNE